MANNPFNKSAADSVARPTFSGGGIGAPKVNIRPNTNQNQRVGLTPSTEEPTKQQQIKQAEVEQPKQVDQSWEEYKAALEERSALAQPIKVDPVEVDKSWMQSATELIPDGSSEYIADTELSKDMRDAMLAVAQGFAGLVGTGGQVYGLFSGNMDNWGTKYAEDARQKLSKRESEELQLLKKAKQNAIDQADGEVNKFFTGMKETLSEPKLFRSFMFEQAPNLLATGVVGRGVGIGIGLTGASGKVAGRAALGGAIGAGGVMQGADSGGEAYKDIMDIDAESLAWATNEAHKNLVAGGMDDEEARKTVALEAARLSAIRSGAVSLAVNGLLPSGTAIERMVTGTLKQGGGGVVKGAAKGFVGETIVEGVDEGFGQLSSNIGVREVDKSRELTEGVGQAASEGAIFGVLGGASGAYQGLSTPESRKRDAQARLAEEIESNITNANTGDPTVDAALALDPSNGSITRAVRKGAEQAATEITIRGSRNTIDAGITPQGAEGVIGNVVTINGREYETLDRSSDGIYTVRDLETNETHQIHGNRFSGEGGIGSLSNRQAEQQSVADQAPDTAPEAAYTEGQEVNLGFSETGERILSTVMSYENGELMVRGEDGDAYLVTDEDIANGEIFVSPVEQPTASYEGASIEELEQALNAIEEVSRETGLTESLRGELAEIESQLLSRFAEEDAAERGLAVERQPDTSNLESKSTSELSDWADRIEAYNETEGATTGRNHVLELINNELEARYAGDDYAGSQLTEEEAPKAKVEVEAKPKQTEEATPQPESLTEPTAEQETIGDLDLSGEADTTVTPKATVSRKDTREETEQAEAQDFTGADGKPKWFGSMPKAIQFIKKNNAEYTHEVKKAGNRWEIHTKPQEPVATKEDPPVTKEEQSAGRAYTQERFQENMNKISNFNFMSGEKREQGAKLFAEIVGAPIKRRGETVEQRAVRFREVKEALVNLSGTTAQELMDNNTVAELKDMGKVLGIGNSRSTKASLAQELSNAPDKVWEKLAERVDKNTVAKRVTELIESNQPVPMADVRQISEGVGTLWTTNDAAVGTALGLEEIQPQGKRGDLEETFNRFAELEDAAMDDALGQYLHDNFVDRELVQAAVDRAGSIDNYEMAASLLRNEGADIAQQLNLPRELGLSIGGLIYGERDGLLDAYPKEEQAPASQAPVGDVEPTAKPQAQDATKASPEQTSKLDSASTKISAKKLEAANKLKKLIDSRKGNLNSGIDPEVMIAVAEVGALSIAEGAVKFAQYVRDVLATTRAVGIDDDDVKPFIKESYGAIQSNPAKYNLTNEQVDVMDAPRDFRDLNIESLIEVEQVTVEPATEVTEPAAVEPAVAEPKASNTRSPEISGGATIESSTTNETKGAVNDSAKRSDRNGRGSDELQPRTPTPKQKGAGEDGAASSQERSKADASANKKRDAARDRGKRSLQGRDESASIDLNKVEGIAEGTAQQRVQGNIDAIRLMKELTDSGRKPTLAEKETLAKYAGWGGLAFVFDSGTNRKYAKEADAELKSLLTETEYNNIRESTRNAFYTSGEIVNAMWEGVKAFGLGSKRMNAVEPSMGTGNFIGFQPESMRQNTKWSGSELDTVTGNIAKLIYPEANIQVRGFQDTPFKQNAFSLAIGNPPFGSQSITDSKMKDISGMSVHNYIIAKSGKLLHENGLMMMVVTNRFLDTKNKNHSQLSKSLEFVGAVRLPNNAFKENAGTSVTTDIVVFRKLAKGEQSQNLVWTDTEGKLNDTKINKWFELNPNMVLGEVSNQGSMYARDGTELTVNPTVEHADLGASITKALTQLAEGNTVTQTAEQVDMAAGEVLLAESDLAIGGMMMDAEGKVIRRNDDSEDGSAQLEVITKDTVWMDYGEVLESASKVLGDKMALEDFVGENLTGKTGKLKSEFTNSKVKKEAFDAVMDVMTGRKTPAEAKPYIDTAINRSRLGEKQFSRLESLMRLRNTALELIRAERQDRPQIEALRKRLNTQYDKFVKENSTRQSKASVEKYLNLLKGDYGIESGLDSVSKSGKVSKHDIFTKRMVYPYKAPTSADNIGDAVTYSIQNRGVVDIGYIAELRNQSTDEVRAELISGERPYLLTDPALGEDVFIDDYLSGNVKRKLKEAEAAGLDVNAKLLREVQPKDKPMDKVKPSIRAGWIDADIFEQYLSALGIEGSVSVNRELGQISVGKNARKMADTELSAPFKHDRASIPQLFDAAATGKSIVVYDGIGNERTKNEKATKEVNALANKMAESFKVWAESDPNVHQRIADNFNERLNGHVTRRYNGRLHLRPVGQNPTINLRSSQLNVAMRMIQSKNVLMDHTVGTGKSYSAITGIMERKRLGLSKKPLMAVPNHIIGSMAKDFYKLYPAANILVASEKSFSAKNRKQFFARIATGDYDAVIVGHSHLRAMQNSLPMYESVINEKISELREALESAKRDAKDSGSRGASVKQIESSISTLKGKIEDRKKALEAGGDKTGFTFEDLGVDYLTIDESHVFKNLTYATKADRVVGMNDPAGSEMALDVLIKARAIQGLDNGGVTFMTGTPISNSLVEIYTTMYYLGHEQLKDMSISAYDAFAGSFINTEIAMEYTPTGTVKERRVLKGLDNLQELSTLYQQFADVITNDDMVEIYKEDVEARNAELGENRSTRYPIPNVKGGGRQLDIAGATESQREYNDYLIARMEAIEAITNRSDRLEYAKLDNPLWVLTDAKKASLDVRLIDPRLDRDPTGKVARAADNIMRLYKDTEADKGTQLVFSDMGTPAKHAKASVRKDLISLAGYVMTDKKAREFINQRAEIYETDAYSRTLADIAELIDVAIESGEIDGGVADTTAGLISDLEGSALTADTGFSVYDDLKAALEEKGMPSDEIAFIHDYNTADQKAGLFDLVNNGDVRVLIGSSAKMGAGTNVQERLVGLHHMDAPWRPSDMEQREGRIIRQGNKLYERAVEQGNPEAFEVEIIAYATQGSSDPVMWQILERKSRSIEQFRNGALDEFTEQGGDSDSYAEFKAASTGNPIYKMKLTSDAELLNAESDYTAKAASKSAAERQIREFEPHIKALKSKIETLDKAQDTNFDVSAVRESIKANFNEFNKAVDAYEKANAQYDEMTAEQRKAQKVTRPTKPVRKPLHLLDNDYSKALNSQIMEPAIKAMAKGSAWSGNLAISKAMSLNVDISPLDGGIFDVSVSYLGSDGASIIMPSRYHLKTMTGSNSLMDNLSLPSIVNDLSREAKRQQSALDTAIKNKPTYERLAKAKINKELAAYHRAQENNLWLMVEAELADIKESLRRGEVSNRFIDRETKRNVKRSTFSASDIKPQDLTFEGKRYKALGVKVPSNHWAYSHLMPALDASNEYVHLKVDREVSEGKETLKVIEVMRQPEGMPSPDISFLGVNIDNSETANFKRWFRKSKAVDAQGKPQVLYHGTRADFTEFRPSPQTGGLIFFSADPAVASAYADNSRANYASMMAAQGQVSTDIAASSNPDLFSGHNLKPSAARDKAKLLTVLSNSSVAGAPDIAGRLQSSTITPTQAVNQYNSIAQSLSASSNVIPVNLRVENPINTPDNPIKWRDAEKVGAEGYKKQGYDGVYVTEGDGVALAVFDANQIKSAIGNNGEYSLDSDNIMLSLSEKVGDDIGVTGAVVGQTMDSSNTMTKEQAQKSADSFMAGLDDNLKVKVRVFNTQVDAYGEKADLSRMVPIMGGYHPEAGAVSIIAGNHSSPAQVRETLRHEILGHYGLDTFPQQERNQILDAIIEAKEHRSLKPLWDRISNSKGYAAMSERGKAEEVFAHIAETDTTLISTIADIIRAIVNRAMRFTGLTKAPITRAETRRIVASIAKGIRNGQRQRVSQGSKADNFKRVGEELPQPPSDQEVDGWFSNKFTDSMKYLLSGAPMDRMIIELGSKVPALTGYLRVKRTMDAYRNRKHGQYNEIAQKWLSFKVKHPIETRKLANIMHQSTLNQVDPSKPFISILTGVERRKVAEGVIGEELAARVAKDEMRREQYTKIKKAYDSLPKEMQEMYSEVRDTYEQQADEYDSILLDNISRALEAQNERSEEALQREVNKIKSQNLSEESKADAISKANNKHISRITKLRFNKAARLAMMRKQFESNRIEAPYFPLARFGDYFVTLQNEGGETVSFSLFETAAEQQKFAKESRESGYKVSAGVMAESDRVQNAIDPNFLVDVNEILENSGVGDNVKDQVWQKYLESLPDLSMRKRRIHRKGQAGYNQDALRAFSSQMFHAAHQMARMKYSPEMESYLKDAAEEAKHTSTTNRDTLVVNEVAKRHQYVMNPKGSAGAQRLTSAAFVYYLGMSPASAIVNMAQTVLIGVPMLGKDFGMMAAQGQLIRALKDFTVGMGSATRGNITAEERAALEYAYDSGVIDKTQGHDLAGVGESGVNYSPVRTRVMGAVSWAFHNAERLNREVTFLAAYRLAKRDGKGGNMNQSQARKAATELVWKTHFDYSNTNRPRVMHGDAAKVALVFRNYQVNMLFRLFRDTHQSLKGETAEAKREARYQLGGITAMMAINAGVRGTWMYGMGMMLASLFFGKGDDVEDEFIKGTQDNLPPWAASVLLNGIIGHFGGASVSERIGLPDLWFRSPNYEMEGRENYNYWVGQMLGAVPSIIEKQVMGINLIAKGEYYRGAETMAPNLIKNPMKAYRYSREGVTNLNDIEILGRDDLSYKDILVQAIGFTPAIVASQYDRNTSIRNAESKIKKARSKALGNFSKAYLNDDSKKQQKALDEIREFNGKYPTIQITNDNINQSIRGKNRRRQQADGGIIVDKRIEQELRSKAPINPYKKTD